MDRENAIQENRKLQDDLAAVTCEVRNMQRELEASRAEAYDLKRQLQTYVSEVRRAEELLNRKVGFKLRGSCDSIGYCFRSYFPGKRENGNVEPLPQPQPGGDRLGDQ